MGFLDGARETIEGEPKPEPSPTPSAFLRAVGQSPPIAAPTPWGDDRLTGDPSARALYDAQQSPLDALTGELGIYDNPRGGISTELSRTVTDERLNGGRPTNIPMLVRGQGPEAVARILNGEGSREDENLAIRRAQERVAQGLALPGYDDIESAVQAARERSAGKSPEPRGFVRSFTEAASKSASALPGTFVRAAQTLSPGRDAAPVDAPATPRDLQLQEIGKGSMWERLTNPDYFADQLAQTIVGTSPSLAGAALGGVLGAASPVPGGAMIGTVIGGGSVAGLQSIASGYETARRQGKNHDQAVDVAMKTGAASAVLSGLAYLTGGATFAKNMVSNVMSKVAVNIGLDTADEAAQQTLTTGELDVKRLQDTAVFSALFEAPSVAALGTKAGQVDAKQAEAAVSAPPDPQAPPPVPVPADQTLAPEAMQTLEDGQSMAPEADTEVAVDPDDLPDPVSAPQTFDDSIAEDPALAKAVLPQEEKGLGIPDATDLEVMAELDQLQEAMIEAEAAQAEASPRQRDTSKKPRIISVKEGSTRRISGERGEHGARAIIPLFGEESRRRGLTKDKRAAEKRARVREDLAAVRDSLHKKGLAPRNVRDLIHRATGMFRVADVVTVPDEAKALARGLKAQEKAGQAGMREGRRFERLRQQAEREVQGLIRNIKQPPGRGIDVEYQKAILAIQEGLSSRGMGRKAAQRRERLKQFVKRQREAGEDPGIGAAKLRELSRRDMNSMTVTELRELAGELGRLRKLGRLKGRLKASAHNRKIDDAKGEIVGALAGRSNPEGVGRVGSMLRSIERPSSMLYRLDGDQEFGPFARYIGDPLRKAGVDFDRRARGVQKRFTEFADSVGGIDALGDAMAKTYRLSGGLVLSGAERVGVAMHAMNGAAGGTNLTKITRDGIVQNGIVKRALTMPEVQSIVGSLNETEKAFVQLLAPEFEAQGNTMAEVAEKVYGLPFQKVAAYFPAFDNSDTTAGEDMFRLSQTGLGTGNKKSVIPNWYTKAREANAHQSLVLDAVEIFSRQVPQANHFMSYAEVAEDMRSIFSDPTVRRSISHAQGQGRKRRGQTKHKTTGRDDLQSIDDLIFNANSFGSFTNESEGWAQSMRSHFVAWALGFKLTTILKQPISLLNGAAEYRASFGGNPRGMLASQVRAVTDPAYRESLREWARRDMPILENRHVDRDFDAFNDRVLREKFKISPGQNRILRGLGRAERRAAELGMAGIMWADEMTTLAVGKNVFDDSLAQGFTREQAIARAELVLERSQPMGSKRDLPPALLDGEFLKLMTMFTNQINQNVNQWARIARNTRSGKISKKQLPAVIMGSVILPGIALSLSDSGLGQDLADEDDPLGALAIDAALAEVGVGLSSLPLVNQVANPLLYNARRALKDGADFDELLGKTLYGAAEPGLAMPANTIMDRGLRAGKALNSGDWTRLLEEVVQVYGMAKGVPTDAFLRAMKGAGEIAEEGPNFHTVTGLTFSESMRGKQK